MAIRLSAAQQKVMDKIHEDVRRARECATVEEWFLKYKASYCNHMYNTPEKYKARDPKEWEDMYVRWYNDHRAGLALTQCSSKTLAKLEKLGLIEIVYDSNGQHYGIDVVKVLDM